MRKRLSPWAHPWAHRDHGGHGSGPNDHGSVMARRGHSSVTARSQLSHGEVTAQSRHLQFDHGSVTAWSQLNHGPGHGSVTAGCDHFGHCELTVSSHGGQFFSHGLLKTRDESWFKITWYQIQQTQWTLVKLQTPKYLALIGKLWSIFYGVFWRLQYIESVQYGSYFIIT